MLRLRPYKPADHSCLMSWVRSRETVKMWKPARFTYPLTEDQMDRYYEDFEADDRGWIFTALDETGQPVGHFCMRLADYEKNSVRLGYIIVNPEIRGKGYGREMVGLALIYALQVLQVSSVTLGVYADNPAARRCYEGLGFTACESQREGSREYVEMEYVSKGAGYGR